MKKMYTIRMMEFGEVSAVYNTSDINEARRIYLTSDGICSAADLYVNGKRIKFADAATELGIVRKPISI
ncbi:hypothetical protein EDD70_2957 [Hydrogenoanaerobacterium saccharovorans]|uniref:Uncharacterized protein n=1 Tax=Hydrogenoanaerobacterium saccharovorans TaxID=474960 RepID=A0A1H7YH16_9FIRM|nr:hypothetical protein [Hydrogenoanaerobacterium saccharovorans]RPF41897.1 hypothetical protein EDD70_2957 [Hydrogenoanaerobacterium saccharovorans]SEM45400.1 hypothetical protein SAMN05216180_0040 [Hydrogenoanaerobacterium saccharovorans]